MPKFRRGNMILETDQKVSQNGLTSDIAILGTRNFYVSTTGSDVTGDGSSGNPWASITTALDFLDDKLIDTGSTVTINIADGTYNIPTLSLSHPNLNRIIISGNTTTPSNVVLQSTDTYTIAAIRGHVLRTLEGVKLSAGVGAETGLIVAASTALNMNDVEIDGYTYGIQFGNGGNVIGTDITIDNCTYGIYGYFGGFTTITNPTITNSSNTAVYAKNASAIRLPGVITLSGNVSNYDPSLNSIGNNNSIITDDG